MDPPILKYTVRQGAIDSGKEYEWKTAALLALRCVHPRISDMWMMSNADGVGAFDDIILQVQTTESETLTYMMQLKHKDKPNNISQQEFLVTRGDFALLKYFKDIDSLLTSINAQVENDSITSRLGRFSDIYFVLFTNRGVYPYNFFQRCDNPNFFCIKTNCSDQNNLYRFVGTLYPDYHNVNTENFHNLYLLSNQVSVKQIDKEIGKELVRISGMFDLNIVNNQTILERFLTFVCNWARGTLGGHYALTNRDVINKLAELLIAQYEIDLTHPSFSNSDCVTNTMWSRFIRNQTITIIDANESLYSHLLQHVKYEVERTCRVPLRSWTDTLSSNEQNLFYREHVNLKTKMLKIVGNHGRITFFDIYRCLWMSGRCPLLLEISDHQSYLNIVNILKLSHFDFKVILVDKSNKKLLNGVTNIQIFRSLKDLDQEDRAEILLHPVKLQGRESANLEDLLDEEMFEYITCGDVISIMSNNFDIGSSLKPLPPYFIRRSITKTFLETKVLKKVADEMFILSNYCTESFNLHLGKDVFYLLKDSDFDKIGKSRIIIVNKDSHLEKIKRRLFTQRVVHHLSIYNKDYLEWKWSSGSTSEISPFRVHLVGEFESDFGPYFSKPMNIISEIPGMGKSVLMDYLALEAPSSKWVQAKTVASKHLNYFYSATKTELNTCDKNLSDLVFQKLLKSKDVIVFLDGFDEVSTSYKKEVTGIIKSLFREGYHVWLTTRPHMKYYLENEFKTLSVSLKPFGINDQETFLMAYFGSRNPRAISDDDSKSALKKFVKDLLKAARKNLFDRDIQFTGVPLQTELLADFFNPKVAEYFNNPLNINFNESFDLLNLYQSFIDKKNSILCDKFGDGMADSHTMCQEDHLLFALRLVFRVDDYKHLQMFQDLDQYKEQRKIELLQRDGVIVIDEEQNVSCIHRTFAEFLAAKWLAENMQHPDPEIREFARNLIKQRFTDGFQFLFSVFDRFLAKDCPLHLAFISGNTKEAVTIANQPSFDRMKTDRGGRSILHIIALYDHQFPLPFVRLYMSKEDTTIYLIKQLIDDLYPAIGNDVMGYSALDYALANRCLLIANKLCEKSKDVDIKVNINLNFKDDCLMYCIKYKALFEVLLEYFLFRSFLLKQVERTVDIKTYLRDSIIYNKTFYLNILKLIKEFKDKSVLQYLKDCDKYKNDFRFILSTDQYSAKLPSGLEKNQLDVDRNSFLHYAVLHDNLKCVEMLLSMDATINIQNDEGNTPLHLAVLEKNLLIMNVLLTKGASVNIANKKGETVLHLAVQADDKGFFSKLMFNCAPISIMKLLFAHGTNIDAQNNNGETPLHAAVLKGCGITVTELLLNGANINKTDNAGNTSLHLALNCNYVNTSDLLLYHGADVRLENKTGETILHTAAKRGCHSIVAKALSKGADINKQDCLENTPLHLALKTERNGKIKGRIPNDKTSNLWSQWWPSISKTTNYFYSVWSTPSTTLAAKNYRETSKLLIRNDANVNTQNGKGRTALHYAAKNRCKDIITDLLAKGADINVQDESGNTALHMVHKKGHGSTAALLILNGAEEGLKNREGMAANNICRKSSLDFPYVFV